MVGDRETAGVPAPEVVGVWDLAYKGLVGDRKRCVFVMGFGKEGCCLG